MMKICCKKGFKFVCSFKGNHGTYKGIWERFWSNATVHGFPYVFASAGEINFVPIRVFQHVPLSQF